VVNVSDWGLSKIHEQVLSGKSEWSHIILIITIHVPLCWALTEIYQFVLLRHPLKPNDYYIRVYHPL
jgi:hypothetical protein